MCDFVKETGLAASNLARPTSLRTPLLLASTLAACGSDVDERSATHDEPAAYESSLDAGYVARDGGFAITSPLDGSAPTSTPVFTAGVTCNDVIMPTSANIQTVLQRSCGLARSCHLGDFPQAGLDLSTLDGIFKTAVERPSTQSPDLKLIAAGKPGESYVLRKIRNLQGVGTAMPPPPSTALCEAKVRALEAWIRAGAQR